MLRWIFPDDEHRLQATAAWLGLFAERYVGGGRVDVIEADEPDRALAAVAVWRWPDDVAPPAPLPSVPGLLAALVGSHRAAMLIESLGVIATVAPPGRFAYLHLLAVSPPHQGQGLGRQVLAPGLAAADAAGLGVHLETTDPDNLGFYRAVGFEVTHQVRLAPDGPELWALWRAPRS